MNTRMRLACTAAMALAALAMGAGIATAGRNVAVERGGAVRISEGRLTFEDTRLVRVICNTSLNGELTTTGVKKTARSLPGGIMGVINEGAFSGCTEGFGGEAEVRLLAEAEQAIPMVYEAFLGTLPRISGILVTALGVRLQLRAFGETCQYTGNIGVLVGFPPAGGGNAVGFLEASRIRLSSGGGLCPREGAVRGSLRMTSEQRVILDGFTPRVGTLRADENPVIIERERTTKRIHLTNNGNEALSVQEVHINDRRGELGATLDRRCVILLPNKRCDVLLTVINRPEEGTGEGTIIFEYINGAGITELEVPYTIN